MIQLVTNRTGPGRYDWRDFNRVGQAMADIRAQLLERGYEVPAIATRSDYRRTDLVTPALCERYLQDVAAVANAAAPTTAQIPATMRRLTYQGANEIEKALQAVYDFLQESGTFVLYMGEFYAGEI